MNYFRILQLLKPLVQRGSIKSIDEALVFLQRQGTKVDGILRKGVENMFKKIKARDPDFNKVVQKLPKDDAGIPFNPNTLKSVAEKNRRVFEKLMKDRGVDASGLKLAKPLKKSSKSFLEEMADRGHKVLKPGTPEYEAYMKKGLRTFPGGRLPETGPGVFNKALNQKTGMFRAIARQILQQDTRLKLKPEELYSLRTGKGEPLDLMKKYYGKSMLNLDAWLDDFLPRTTLPPRDLASRVLNEVELIPQFASGGLARILEL